MFPWSSACQWMYCVIGDAPFQKQSLAVALPLCWALPACGRLGSGVYPLSRASGVPLALHYGVVCYWVPGVASRWQCRVAWVHFPLLSAFKLGYLRKSRACTWCMESNDNRLFCFGSLLPLPLLHFMRHLLTSDHLFHFGSKASVTKPSESIEIFLWNISGPVIIISLYLSAYLLTKQHLHFYVIFQTLKWT